MIELSKRALHLSQARRQASEPLYANKLARRGCDLIARREARIR